MTACVLGAAATALVGARLATFGSRPAFIQVRWAPALPDDLRLKLESRFGLTAGTLREERTWGYTLTDVSRDNIRALVGSPSVEDTHNIHRTAFRPWRTAPRLPYLTARPWVPALLDIAALLAALAAAVTLIGAALDWWLPNDARKALRRFWDAVFNRTSAFGRRALSTIGTGIPQASAEAAAVFRVIFGSGLIWVVFRQPVDSGSVTNATNTLSSGQELILRGFAAVPWLADGIEPWVAIWGLLFIVGAFSRTAFAMLTLGVFAWALLFTTNTTYHTVCALLTALVCLLWSRWGDAWSVDASRGARPSARAQPRHYGYTIWMPGVVLGVTFAAAAVAKLRESGMAWILNGTVKYHFLTDSRQALIDWGLQVGHYPALAVALSLAAVVVEAGVIVGALSGTYRYRMVAGIASVLMVSGFTFLQGIFWPGWWLLCLSFLPWHRIKPVASDPLAGSDGAHDAGRGWRFGETPGVTVALALIIAQSVISAFHVEGSPLMSTYDMYATTYDSPEDFERKAGEGFFLIVRDDQRITDECRLTRQEAELLSGSVHDPPQREPAADIFLRCFPPPITIVDAAVERVRTRVDWTAWRLQEPARVRMASGPALLP